MRLGPGAALHSVRLRLLGRCDLDEDRLGFKLFLSIHTNNRPVQEHGLRSCPATHHGLHDRSLTAYNCPGVRLLETVVWVYIIPSKRHIFRSCWRCAIDADTRHPVSTTSITRQASWLSTCLPSCDGVTYLPLSRALASRMALSIFFVYL